MIDYFFPLSVKVNILRYGGQKLSYFIFSVGCLRIPNFFIWSSIMPVILVPSFPLAGDCGIGGKNLWLNLRWNTLWCPLSWPCRVFVPRSANQTKTSWPSFCCWSWTSPYRNLRLSSLARKPKCRDKNHHTVLWSATGLESPNSPASKKASSSSIAWAACGLFPFAVLVNKWLSLRCKDLSGFFELIVLE